MTDRPASLCPRPAALAACFAYIVAAKLVPYVLMNLGVVVDAESTTYPWNFSALPAFCLFGAAFVPDRRLGYALPMLAWFVGDLGIWAITGHVEWAFYPDQVFVYGAIALTVTVGFVLRRSRAWPALLATGFATAVLFYLVTNFGLWACGNGTQYPHTAAGLLDCYVRAVPFFRNHLIGTLAFSALLFSPLAGARLLVRRDVAVGAEPARDAALAAK
jgi:hypothetical protein